MDFDKNFVWGCATSSYQIEGAHNIDGKGPSIWDAFCSIPGKITNNEHGNVANDHYHRFKDDVKILKELGVDAYRFSISWARILPDGKGKVNEKGIEFYNNLIDELLENGIKPWVTLYHWDLPLALQLEHSGWLSRDTIKHFVHYAETCFKHFGDRVDNWITFNEPWVVSILGHGVGVFAPGRVSKSEPYLVAHHLILAHAETVKVFRDNYKREGAKIGMSNNCDWREPLTNKNEDIEAALRSLEFFLGWFADPIYLGDYPKVMKKRLGDRLPEFTIQEKKLIKGSSDFFGLNHYTTMYASHDITVGGQSVYGNGGISEDQSVALSVSPDWKFSEMNWAVAPWGLRKLLNWIKERYANPDVYITENGYANKDSVINGEIDDQNRLEYHSGYIEACSDSIGDGVSLKGYFAWSFMDNFEWAQGFSKRFGLYYVDFDSLDRVPKNSAKWYSAFIKKAKI